MKKGCIFVTNIVEYKTVKGKSYKVLLISLFLWLVRLKQKRRLRMKKIFNIMMAILLAGQFAFYTTSKVEAAEDSGVVIENEEGWKSVNNRQMYYSENKAVKGWQRIGGLWYYFNKEGHMVSGVQTINANKYVFNQDGSLKEKLKNNSEYTSVVEENKTPAPAKSSNNARIANGVYDRSGNLIGTGRKYISNASAYSGDTTTASGQRPRWGTIAVDPKVIPLGSRVYVPYYDKVFIANDTGGIIRGTMIDIFMKSPKNMRNFGRRNIEIYVLNK